MGGVSGVTTALGPILGGFLVENVSWRAAFLVNVPLAVAVLLIAWRHVPESRDPNARKLDIPGVVLATTGLGGALYFLPLLLIQVHGYSATAAGSSFLPFVIITFLMSRWAGGLITRFGARPPLVIGPLIAAAGFVLFAIPGTGGSYWTTFFPAIVVLGFGMALVIVPLTTTALNSVSGRHSGLASGVNNAVARTAGLLAIPVLGIFVFHIFSGAFDARAQSLDLSPQVQKQLESEKEDLGGAESPSGVSGEKAAQIERAIDESFLAAFRLAMLIAAGLAVASAVAAAVIIEGKERAAPAERVGQTAPA
ncbi:MAG TPA: MFS transporter [Rubrobacter sp.]|nr:MFS transporter [Rubrobacter sp.]